MHSIEDYKKRVLELDQELNRIIKSVPISRGRINSLQKKLDQLDIEYYRDDYGNYSYKMFEIQAFIHFIRNDYAKALIFLQEAVNKKGSSYARANNLEKAINNGIRTRNHHIKTKLKLRATQNISSGFVIMIIGIFITGLTYELSQHIAAELESISTLGYILGIGIFLFGVIHTARGLIGLRNYESKAAIAITAINGR